MLTLLDTCAHQMKRHSTLANDVEVWSMGHKTPPQRLLNMLLASLLIISSDLFNIFCIDYLGDEGYKIGSLSDLLDKL